MHKLSLSSLFDIQLFGEGGGPGGGTGGGAGAEGAGQTAAAPAQPQTGAKGNSLADVQYGKQEEPAAAVPVPEDRNAQFEAMIKGEYKDLYDQRMQDTIQKRLKGTAETVNRYNALSPVLDLLASKYGVDAGDAEALAKAIEEDESFYENEAMERGLTVDQLKQIRKMERENAALKEEMQEKYARDRANEIYGNWVREGEELKQVYPDFDLETEINNERFRQLLNSNVPMRTAYEVMHWNEILPTAMQFSASKTAEKIANSVKAGQSRPAEGAMSNRSPVKVKSDVSQLTKADIAEINRRVARGERIVF